MFYVTWMDSDRCCKKVFETLDLAEAFAARLQRSTWGSIFNVRVFTQDSY